MFQLVWILIVGLILGVLAKALLPGDQSIPLWLTVVLGALGAWLGNGIAGWIGVRHTSGIDWIRHVLQVGCAVVLVGLAAPWWSQRKTKTHA